MNYFDLQGKVALVTGASSGLGEHFAKALAAQGAAVALAARREERLHALVETIERSGGKAFAVAIDVDDQSSIAPALDQIEANLGSIDILINNAGIARVGKALSFPPEHWRAVMATNLDGAWYMAQSVGQRMVNGGSIVNISSVLGLRVAPGYAAYATAKAALLQMSKSLALEWASKGIRVNALCPGFFKTDINAEFLESDQGQALLRNTPAGRPGELDELVAPMLLLASDAGRFITGAELSVDGGHCLA